MLELYQRESCPYCKPVRQLLTDLNIDYVLRNLPKDRSKRTELIDLTGVPFIPAIKNGDDVVAGKLEYNDHIMDYIKEHFG